MLTTAHLQRINVKQFRSEGTMNATWGKHSGTFNIVRRPSNVGGSRLWLQCACGRTVKHLYHYQQWMRCRHCFNLAYQCQTVDMYTRAQWQVDKLRKRLPCGARRPKGMHLKTFRNIKAAIHNAEEKQDDYLLLRFGRRMGLKSFWGR